MVYTIYYYIIGIFDTNETGGTLIGFRQMRIFGVSGRKMLGSQLVTGISGCHHDLDACKLRSVSV